MIEKTNNSKMLNTAYEFALCLMPDGSLCPIKKDGYYTYIDLKSLKNNYFHIFIRNFAEGLKTSRKGMKNFHSYTGKYFNMFIDEQSKTIKITEHLNIQWEIKNG